MMIWAIVTQQTRIAGSDEIRFIILSNNDIIGKQKQFAQKEIK